MENNITVPVYSEQELSPRAAEVIRKIADDMFPEYTIKFRLYNEYDQRVLVFGRAPSGVQGIEFVYTYSIAQVMSKPNAATVLAAGIRQFIAKPVMPDFQPVGTLYFGPEMAVLDFSRPTAIDIETDGNLGKTHTAEEVNVISVAFYQEGHPPIVLTGPSKWDDNGDTIIGPLGLVRHELAEFIQKFEKPIYHNGKFDVRVMSRYFGVELNVWFDTMLAHHTLNHAAGKHDLKTLARRYLGAPEWEAGLSKYTKQGGHYEYIPHAQLVEYNGWDVYWTYELYKLFAPQIEADENFQKSFELEMAAADFLLEVERTGIPFDDEYAEEFYNKQMLVAENTINNMRDELGDQGFNPNSPTQVTKALTPMTGKLWTKTDVDTLEEYMKEYPDTTAKKFITNLLAYRKATKIARTYITGWRKHMRNGRVHPTFHVHGTTTGRLSSGSPNAQNVPRDKAIRRLVKVSNG